MNNEHEHVAVFWDYENCAPPSTVTGYDIVDNIRRIAHTYGSVKLFKAYLELSQLSSSRSLSLRSELQSCGVSLTDCPHNGGKDVADKMMIVDMLTYAMDTPPPATIIIITGDRDFVYAVSVLRLRRYRVVLIAPSLGHNGLKLQASAVLDWDVDILGKAGRESNRASHRRSQSSTVPPLVTTPLQKGQRRLSFCDNAVPSLAEPLQPAVTIRSPNLKKHTQTSLPAVNAAQMADTELPDAELSEVNSDKQKPNSAPFTAGYATVAKAVQTAEDVEDIVGSGAIADLNLHLHNLHNQEIYANLLPESSADVSEANSNTPIDPNEVEQQTPLEFHVANEGSEYESLIDRPSSSPSILRECAASPTSSYHHESISSERVTTLGATPMTPAQEIENKHETRPAEPIPSFSRLLLILHDLRKRGMSRPLRTVVCNMLLHRYGREVFVSAGVDTWTQYAAAAESLGIVTLGGEQGDTWISLNETRFLSFQAYLEDVEQQENKCEEPQPPFMPILPVPAEHANAQLPATSQLREDIAQETDAVETRESIGPTPLDSNDTKGQSSALPSIPIYYYDLLVVLETFMKRGVYSPWCEDVSRALLQRNPNIYQYAGVETWEAYASQAFKLGMVVLGSSNEVDWIALKPSWYDVVPESYAAEVHDHVSDSAVEAPSVQPTLMLDHPHSPTSSVSPQDGPTQPTLSSLAPHFLALVTVLERFRRQNITHPLRSKVNAALMEEDPNAFQSAGVTRWKEFADLAVQEGIVVLGGLRAAPWISLEPTWHGKVHPH